MTKKREEFIFLIKDEPNFSVKFLVHKNKLLIVSTDLFHENILLLTFTPFLRTKNVLVWS